MLVFIYYSSVSQESFLKLLLENQELPAQYLHCASRQFSSCMNPLVHLPVQYMLRTKGSFLPYHTPVNTSELSHSKL